MKKVKKPLINSNQLNLFDQLNINHEHNEQSKGRDSEKPAELFGRGQEESSNEQRIGRDVLHRGSDNTTREGAGIHGVESENVDGSALREKSDHGGTTISGGEVNTDDETAPIEIRQNGIGELRQRNGFSGSADGGGESDNRGTRIINYHREEDFSSPYKSFNKRRALENNIAALKVLRTIKSDKRFATDAEQEVLAQYVGFGGLKEVLLDVSDDAHWNTSELSAVRPFYVELNAIVSSLDENKEGFLANIKSSVLNAHFTGHNIISGIYKALEKKGFKGGKILEPSAGVGNFLSALPLKIAQNSEVTAVEKETLSGAILGSLFPSANIFVSPMEKATLPKNEYDLIIGNVPFGDFSVYDKEINNHTDKSYRGVADNIHNYFFAKSIDLAAPGGVIALITSRYTLDSRETKFREFIDGKCDFLGAIRLPNSTFKVNAGTEVVADIIYLRKRKEGEEKKQCNFITLGQTTLTDEEGEEVEVAYNSYYHDNPHCILGKIVLGGLYNDESFDLTSDLSTEQISDQVAQLSGAFMEGVKFKDIDYLLKKNFERYINLEAHEDIGNIVIDENKPFLITSRFYINNSWDMRAKEIGINPNNARIGRVSAAEEAELEKIGLKSSMFRMRVIAQLKHNSNVVPLDVIRDYIALRNTLKKLLISEHTGVSDDECDKHRQALNISYDHFCKLYGNVLRSGSKYDSVLDDDVDFSKVQSLENIRFDNGIKIIEKADIFSKRIIRPIQLVEHTDNIHEAVSLSYNLYGAVNTNYICEVMDKTVDMLKEMQAKELSPELFWHTDGKVYSRLEYLSGNVVARLDELKQNAKDNSTYAVNIRELENVQPLPIEPNEIYSPPDARWIPKDIIDAFVKHCFGGEGIVAYVPKKDEYTVKNAGLTEQARQYATKYRPSSWIMYHVLNGINPMVVTEAKTPSGTEKVFQYDDTNLAREMCVKITNVWNNWKYDNVQQRERLKQIYNSLANQTRLPEYSGKHLTLPGYLGPPLRPHQKDAVFRAIHQQGGLNDHMVGAGKTLIEICTAMELRRLGMANKPMIIGIKAQLPQLYESLRSAYPMAKILYPKNTDFAAKKRHIILNSIATNDWDCILITHENFMSIRQSIKIQMQYVQQRLDELQDDILSAGIKGDNDKSYKQLLKDLEARKLKLVEKLNELLAASKDPNVMDFDKLGVDFLIVDESHEFKNLEYSTRKTNVKGLGNQLGSKKAFNLKTACLYLQDKRGGDKGVLFNSGTPVTNSMGELYLLMSYLRPSQLKKMGLTTFDKWASVFTVCSSELEYYLGNFKQVYRMREFVNVPELITMYREFTDVRNDYNLTLQKPSMSHSLVNVKPNDMQVDLIEKLQAYIATKGNDFAAELGLTNGYDDKKQINPSYAVMAQTFARKIAIDPRLWNASAEAGTKLEEAAANIYNHYAQSSSHKGTQLVFCDIGTPQSSSAVGRLYDHLSEDPTYTSAEIVEIFGKYGNNVPEGESPDRPTIAKIKDNMAMVLHLAPDEIEQIVNDSQTNEKFNVYSEMKMLLMKKGVPAHEIDFIHNYETEAKKETFFKQVNDGDVRIVLGSTKKLGIGINVQTRIIALHHLDITWRPDQIEQRNGRGARQGNELVKMFYNNVLPVFYYATDRTLDASMYNLNSIKAKNIATLKLSSDATVRFAKDVVEEIDMGSMAAELSGNPLFKEKEQTRRKIEELSSLKSSFLSKKYSAENRLQDAANLKTALERRIEAIKVTLPYVNALPKTTIKEVIEGVEKTTEHTTFSASIRSTPCENIKQLGTLILNEVSILHKKNTAFTDVVIGNAFGFDILATRKSHLMHGIIRTIKNPDGLVIDSGYEFPSTEMANGLQVRNAILYMKEELVTKENALVRAEENINQLQAVVQDVFAHDGELQFLQLRAIQINDEIAKSIAPKKKTNEVDEQTNLDLHTAGEKDTTITDVSAIVKPALNKLEDESNSTIPIKRKGYSL